MAQLLPASVQEQGTENAGTKEEEEGKAAGKRGNSTGKVGATRLKTRIRGNGKPKDGERKDRKDDKEEEVSGHERHTRKI
jgi:hypothetical protein